MASLGSTPSYERLDATTLARVFSAFLIVIGILLALLYSLYLKFTALGPNELSLEDIPDPSEIEVDESGRKLRFGSSSLSRHGKLWELRVEGQAPQIGAATGRLAGRLFFDLDVDIEHYLHQRYPSELESWAERMLLRWDYNGADEGLSENEKNELSAFAQFLPHHKDEGSNEERYQRLFLYQSSFALSHRLQDMAANGNMFAFVPQSGDSSRTSNLLVGRSFGIDLDLRLNQSGPRRSQIEDFSPPRIVSFVHPHGKYPFASVGWPGMLGVVTGVNIRGIFVSANPVQTDSPSEERSRPLPYVLREILENADSLDTALSILADSKLQSPATILIADGARQEARIVEADARPRKGRRIVRGDGESLLWATNHLLKEPYTTDARNDRVMRSSSSGYRYNRLEELLRQNRNPSPEKVVNILRDRKGHEGRKLGLGNRNALENLQLDQAVVVDLSAMVMWVAEGPSALGRFRAFDLRGELSGSGEHAAAPEDFSPDPLLYSEEFQDYQEARLELRHAIALFAQGHIQDAQIAARSALVLAPSLGETHRILGDIERELDHPEVAIEHYERYLELIPGRLRNQERVRSLLHELERYSK